MRHVCFGLLCTSHISSDRRSTTNRLRDPISVIFMHRASRDSVAGIATRYPNHPVILPPLKGSPFAVTPRSKRKFHQFRQTNTYERIKHLAGSGERLPPTWSFTCKRSIQRKMGPVVVNLVSYLIHVRFGDCEGLTHGV